MDKGENGMQIILDVLPDLNLGPLVNKTNTLLQDPHRFTIFMQLKSYDGRQGQGMVAWQQRKVTYGFQDKGENGTHFTLKSLNPISNKQTPCAPQIHNSHEGSTTKAGHMVARQAEKSNKW